MVLPLYFNNNWKKGVKNSLERAYSWADIQLMDKRALLRLITNDLVKCLPVTKEKVLRILENIM